MSLSLYVWLCFGKKRNSVTTGANSLRRKVLRCNKHPLQIADL